MHQVADAAAYAAMAGTKARNALTHETRLDVLQAVADGDLRAIVVEKAKIRLRVLGASAPPVLEEPSEAFEADPPRAEVVEQLVEAAPSGEADLGDSTNVEPEVPRTLEAPEFLRDLGEPETEEPSTDDEADVLAPPVDIAGGDGLWTCTKCEHRGPQDDFGVRIVGGRFYRQPQCRKCRHEATRETNRKIREEAEQLGITMVEAKRRRREARRTVRTASPA